MPLEALSIRLPLSPITSVVNVGGMRNKSRGIWEIQVQNPPPPEPGPMHLSHLRLFVQPGPPHRGVVIVGDAAVEGGGCPVCLLIIFRDRTGEERRERVRDGL